LPPSDPTPTTTTPAPTPDPTPTTTTPAATTTPAPAPDPTPTTTTPAPAPDPTPTTTPAPTSDPTPTPAAAGWNGFGAGNWPTGHWRAYADSSPFNQPASSAAVLPNSSAMVQSALQWGAPGNMVDAAGASNDWAHPTYYAQPSDPIFTLHALSGSKVLEGMKIPIPDAAKAAAGGDGHLTVVTPDGWEYDFWQVVSKPQGGGTLTYNGGGRTRIDGDGLGSYGTAAGFGNLAGMIRAQELAAGHIDHALFIVLKCTGSGANYGYGAKQSASGGDGGYVYPATHAASSCSSKDPNMPPAGARFQLAMSDAQIAGMAVPSWQKTILTALAHYGGYVGDTGGSGFGFMFESSTMYTSLGRSDPLAQLAQQSKVPSWNGQYVFHVGEGVDWGQKLRVVAPPA
jgi:hypothetical protein